MGNERNQLSSGEAETGAAFTTWGEVTTGGFDAETKTEHGHASAYAGTRLAQWTARATRHTAIWPW